MTNGDGIHAKAYIDKYHEGNVAEFEAEIASGRRYLMQWADIITATTCLPELEEDAYASIKSFMGYLPKPIITLPHESFVRVLVTNVQAGHISKETFTKEMMFHAKRIRNDDMKKNGWASKNYFNDDGYRLYDTHLQQFTYVARQRLSRFLSYEPSIEYSLSAEINLRQLFLFDDYFQDMPFEALDYRCATIYSYQKHLFSQGIEAADDSSLCS